MSLNETEGVFNCLEDEGMFSHVGGNGGGLGRVIQGGFGAGKDRL